MSLTTPDPLSPGLSSTVWACPGRTPAGPSTLAHGPPGRRHCAGAYEDRLAAEDGKTAVRTGPRAGLRGCGSCTNQGMSPPNTEAGSLCGGVLWALKMLWAVGASSLLAEKLPEEPSWLCTNVEETRHHRPPS